MNVLFQSICRRSRFQQQPLFRLFPPSLNTSSHSLSAPDFLPLLRYLTPSSPNPLLILPPPSSQPKSPYCMPLAGSSGSISPSSILVKIILANLLNSSSTFSPFSAETSTATGIPFCPAHRDAVSVGTSRPSGAIVYEAWRFALRLVALLDCDDGVGGGSPLSELGVLP